MKHLIELSGVLQDSTPLLSELLVSSGGEAIAALLANHLGIRVEYILPAMQSDDATDVLGKIQHFEQSHTKRFEAMLLTVAEVNIDGFMHQHGQSDQTSSHTFFSYLVGILTGVSIMFVISSF